MQTEVTDEIKCLFNVLTTVAVVIHQNDLFEEVSWCMVDYTVDGPQDD